MTIEAELKARVRDAEGIRAKLRTRAPEEVAIYADTYFDTPGGDLARGDQELRVREVRTEAGVKSVLTFKDAAVDAASGSKPETETTVGDADSMREMLRSLGFVVDITFEKHCSNYRFAHGGMDMLATVVHVPELDGTFIEVETLIEENDVQAALAVVREVLGDLDIRSNDETTETYTGAVRAARDAREDQIVQGKRLS